MIVKGSVLLALAGGVLAALQSSAAGAQLRCTEQRVEYLVGGTGAAGARSRMCAHASAPGGGGLRKGRAVDQVGNAASPGHRPVIVQPDDDGRRAILNHELDKERDALRRLQAQEGAGGADAQLAVNRHQSNIRALAAELQRLPASVRRQP